jgi:hypothetical protein
MVYTDIPSPQKFQSDTTVDTKLFGKHRSPDPVVLQIDRLLTDYATVDDNHRPDVLYYLYLVTHFCRRKIEVTPKNTPPTGFQDPNSTLPKTEKISTNIVTRGTLREATDALYTIAQTAIRQCSGQSMYLTSFLNGRTGKLGFKVGYVTT